MRRDQEKLRDDALRIWRAAVEAVRPVNLIPQFVAVEGNVLRIGDEEFDLTTIERIAVVGAGKAGAEMAVALESTLGERVLRDKGVTGWVNVPANCLRPTQVVHLHAARPAGINEPTAAGVTGTEEILRLVADLDPSDLCLCLISGGGSALLPAPIEGFSLQSKIELTREIASRGGNIQELNTVRRELSRVKGGRLSRACQAGQLFSLILSDVLGDDLSVIASGPTVLRDPTPELAVDVLYRFKLEDHPAGSEAIRLLTGARELSHAEPESQCQVTNIIIGNNATAVDAAGIEAETLGYSHAMISAREPEGPAEDIAAQLVDMAVMMRGKSGPNCLISGGEPTVTLCDAAERGLGGRNQQLALTAIAELDDWQGLALVSGGTDGEDGPTDAAGAFVDERIAERSRKLQLDPQEYLRRNDAYHFFEQAEGLIKTGPTHTNVCDLRVICVARQPSS